MTHDTLMRFVIGCTLVAALAAPVRAGTPTLYVSMMGTDAPECGEKRNPCRTISRAVQNAPDGALVVVGPGRYGDLNADGVLDADPEAGEEDPVPCGSASCAVRLSKPITVVSSDGPGATVIDAGTKLLAGVFVTSDDVQLGREKQGFTIAGAKAEAVLVRAGNVRVEGNIVSGNAAHGVMLDVGARSVVHRNTVAGNGGRGVVVARDAIDAIVSENHVAGNGYGGSGGGLMVRAPAVVVGNVLSANEGPGIEVGGANVRIEGNRITGNFDVGVELGEGGQIVRGNAVTGNAGVGVVVGPGVDAEVTGNDLFGNHDENCALLNLSPALIDASDNYWGAPGGPGATPADDVCDAVAGAQTTIAPVREKAVEPKLAVGR